MRSKLYLILSFLFAVTAQAQQSVKITDGSRLAAIKETGAADSLMCAIVDGSGTQITSFGGGTQYTEGDTDSTITGTAAMWEDGSDTLRAVSAAKPLPVSAVQSGTWDEVGINDSGNSITVDGTVTCNAGTDLNTSALATSANQSTEITALQLIDDIVKTDDAAFTPATDEVAMIGATFDDTAPDSVNEGDAGAARMSGNRNLYTQIRDAEGNERGLKVNLDGAAWANIRDEAGNQMAQACELNTPYAGWPVGGVYQDSRVASMTDEAFDLFAITAKRAMYVVPETATAGTIADDTADALRVIIRDAAGDSAMDGTNDSVKTTIVSGLATAEGSLSVLDDWDNGASDGASVSGDVAHDTADAGEPVKTGFKAIVFGATPTEVTANDRSQAYGIRAGIPFTLTGHMNPVLKNLNITDADGAQDDTAIVTVSAGTKIVVTHITATCDTDNTASIAVRVGFGTANTPALDAAGVILHHPDIAAGSGIVLGNGGGILGVGADDEDLRLDMEDPTSGSCDIVVGYFLTGS